MGDVVHLPLREPPVANPGNVRDGLDSALRDMGAPLDPEEIDLLIAYLWGRGLKIVPVE